MNPMIQKLPTKVETDRLALRLWDMDDAPQLLALHRESAEQLSLWYGGILGKTQISLEDAQTYINNALSGWYVRSLLELAAFSKETGELVGACSFHHLDWTVPKGRIGYFVRKNEGGKAYATEMTNALTRYAFERLELKRLEIRTCPQNEATCKVPRKLGYQFLTVFEKNKVSTQGTLWDLEIHVRFDTEGLPELSVKYYS